MKIAHLSMILPESRFPLFGIMLYARQQHSIRNLPISSGRKCTGHNGYGRAYMRPISSNVAGNVP